VHIAALAHLRRLHEARSECEKLLLVTPEFRLHWVNEHLHVAHQQDVLAGLTKAGVT
jgi:hypothetical protein